MSAMKKSGGSYRFVESRARHIDEESSAPVLANGLSVPFEDIRGLCAEVSG